MFVNIILCLLLVCVCVFILIGGISLLVISEIVTKEEVRCLFKKRKDNTKF